MNCLISIDPGKNEFAWAYFINKKLERCGMGGIRKIQEIFYGALVEEFVIEVPQIYLQRGWKGDPNDLIDVAITSGRIAAIAESKNIKTEFVRPHAWKGNRPKDIDNNYTLTQLTPQELRIFNACTAVKSKRHNVIDAIGIGLWKLGRR